MTPKRYFYVLLAIIGLAVAAGAGGYYLAIKEINTAASGLSNQLAQQTAADNQIDSLIKLNHQYEHDIVPILPLIDEALPRNKNQSEILAQLQRIAASVGLQITTVSLPNASALPTNTSQTVASGSVLALPINFQISGSYSQLQTFLSRVETLSRFTSVTNLAITRPDKTKPITYSISLNAYIKP